MPRLLIDLTYHGFGHVGQTAPVIDQLRKMMPNLELTIRTAIPYRHLASRFSEPFDHVQTATDIGIPMLSFREVDRKGCLEAYSELHKCWDSAIEHCANATLGIAPDLVLANASYLALASAVRAGIPAIGFSSLNWADIFGHYFQEEASVDRILNEMRSAYASAAIFLKPTPAMPMAWLSRTASVGPVAEVGRWRREELLAHLGLPDRTRLILAAFGGMPVSIDCSAWPRMLNTHFIVPSNWKVDPEVCTVIDRIGMSFSDLIRSCDAVITKPGYGIIVEAACNGTAVLSIPRTDWPEQYILEEWCRRNGRIRPIGLETVMEGKFGPVLDDLMQSPRPLCPRPRGIDEAAAYLNGYLSGGYRPQKNDAQYC